ncbi:surfeit locus protein 6 homolog [Battus philenor]|uniref:surfeit locus protein 6 homolog n=1 Tax=Battus philenor TaxID=42288 RepID=UPI0035CEF3AE
MISQKRPLKTNQLKKQLSTELQFIKNILSCLPIPIHLKDDDSNNDFELTASENPEEKKDLPKRAASIIELEEKLQKLKSQNNFHLKNKLAKKSINSKLNKKLKKKERINKTNVKKLPDFQHNNKQQSDDKANVNLAKPIYNNEGKLVFSKFDFASFGKKEKGNKVQKDPKKLLDEIEQQENKFRQLQESDQGSNKVKELKEKIAWKNILQKAEGQKVKDDPILLKKSIKRMEQKKKVSKKQWENRIKTVEQKKDERQKKRRENISKKKKEKKSKIVKAAVKRGRVIV